MSNASSEDDRRRALDGSLRWTFAAKLQLERLTTVQRDLAEKAQSPDHAVGDDDETRRPFFQLGADRHFLLVALHNVNLGLRLLEVSSGAEVPSELVSSTLSKHIRLLRNIFEHWDADPNNAKAAWSADEFKSAFPGTDPGLHQFDLSGEDALIGGLRLRGISPMLDEINAWLLDLESTSFVWRGWSER